MKSVDSSLSKSACTSVSSPIKLALLQMNSSDVLIENLDFVAVQLEIAGRDGVDLVLLPENFAQLARRTRDQYVEPQEGGKIKTFLSEQAAQHKLHIIAGSIPTQSEIAGRVYARCEVFDDVGQHIASYNKIHLFDVDLADGQSYRESNHYLPGDHDLSSNNLDLVETKFAKLGLTICYDLRFPELYRELSSRGAHILCVPSAFTDTTGQAHWATLLRARAIENQCYVMAAAQVGKHANGRQTYGHSMIIDPWGTVIAEQTEQLGLMSATIELSQLTNIRNRFPALSQRRL